MTRPTPPIAKIEPTIHAYRLGTPDNYHWLKDRTPGTSKREDIMDYLKAENEYAKKVQVEPHTDLSDKIYKEILSRVQETDEEAPYFRNGYYYNTKTIEGQQYPIYVRRHLSLDAPEEEYLNPNLFTEEYVSVGAVSISASGKKLAYSLDTSGAEKYRIFVKDLETGELLSDEIEGCSPSIEWDLDDKAFYYMSQDDLFRADKLYKHVLGQDVKSDTLLYHNLDEKFFAHIWTTNSGRFLVLSVASSQTSENHILDLQDPGAELKVFLPREHRHEYSIEHQGDYFLILTNGGGKFLNKKLQRVRVEDFSRDLWEDVIPYNPYHEISQVLPFAGFIAIQERVDGIKRIRVLENIENPESSYLIPFEEEIFQAGLGYSNTVQDFNSDSFRFSYVSQLTPRKTLTYNVKTRELTLLKQVEVPGGLDATQYTLKRIQVPIPKATRVKAPFDTPVADAIPVTILYKNDSYKADNTNKVYLYGYGSYGAPMDPNFSATIFSLLDRGIVFAVAHVRGGGELGRGWYETGKFLNKKNTFTDFVASAEYLVAQGITQHQLIAIEGGSAGGLLMGGVLNIKPDVAVACIASVPFVDVINTMMDPTIPLTVAEYEEWGNPNEKEYFDYMLSYSPYENIRANTKYPNLFVKAGINDPRVQYWEPAKYVAKLRASNTDGGNEDPNRSLLIFDCKMGSGHFGSSGRYGYLKEKAIEYAFIVSQLEASAARISATLTKKWIKTTTTTTTTVKSNDNTTVITTATKTLYKAIE
ncbi:UNVERIFIED_CONTAM: hypothetical protein HDU68_005406 [Siphonaria sp. JEL0065]|nr:hypothetical protein HDU68_005406 [Siphonaria sp. JEL0065]